jgi:uncharacterized protein (TIGR02145 family)
LVLAVCFQACDLNSTSPSDEVGITDFDGNVYTSVIIGDQEWMVENLKVTHYRNGDEIPEIIPDTTWANMESGAYCNYQHDEDNAQIYGRLYNWYAVLDERMLAPEGWHIPSQEEWQILVDYLGGTSVAGGKLMEADFVHWNENINANSTNESGFSALPTGHRDDYTWGLGFGRFSGMSSSTKYMSQAESGIIYFILMQDYSEAVWIGEMQINDHYKPGHPVRCIKD